MATQLKRKQTYETPVIPDRLYFKIGDVAELCGVETYVLRFWESQFPQLRPNKSGTGQRLYRRRDVETALEIKRLVHADGYTIAGARSVLSGELRKSKRAAELKSAPQDVAENQVHFGAAAVIGHARAELREISVLLSSPVKEPEQRKNRVAPIRAESGFLF